MLSSIVGGHQTLRNPLSSRQMHRTGRLELFSASYNVDEEGADHPVAFFSWKLLPCEEQYSTTEKECLAIKLAKHAFTVYMLGRPFTIQTDHQFKENNAQLTRWSLLLQLYQYQVEYTM